MKLTPGERERLKQLHNTFLAAQRRCADVTEKGRLKKVMYSALVTAFGYVLEDNSPHAETIARLLEEIKSFGVISQDEINKDHS